MAYFKDETYARRLKCVSKDAKTRPIEHCYLIAYTGAVSPALLKSIYEKDLYAKLLAIEPEWDTSYFAGNYTKCLELAKQLQPLVSKLLSHVTIHLQTKARIKNICALVDRYNILTTLITRQPKLTGKKI